MFIFWRKRLPETIILNFSDNVHKITLSGPAAGKCQIISKRFFDVFYFLQKTNKNKSNWGIIVVKSNSFFHFLEENGDTKNHFEILWPLKWNISLITTPLVVSKHTSGSFHWYSYNHWICNHLYNVIGKKNTYLLVQWPSTLEWLAIT